MPLVWAHAEYIKLLRSLRDGKVFDLPPQTVQRYLEANTPSLLAFWQYNQKFESFPAGKILRIGLLKDALVHWSSDNWQTTHDVQTQDTGLGVYIVDLPTTGLAPLTSLVFTFEWTGSGSWEGVNYTVQVEG
jgi:glucoamylase